MRPSFFARLGLAVCGTLGLWLLSASAVDAAPVSRRHAHVIRHACDSGGIPHQLCVQTSLDRAGHGSVRYLRLATHRLVRRNAATWLERRRTSPLRDTDAAALQSSAAAVSGEFDWLVLASLKPLGVLWSPSCRITSNGTVTPRSPRGPPSSPA